MATYYLAWESTNYAWNSWWHAVGAFVTSAGFAGLTAVAAAVIAAWQVKRTREQERTRRQIDDLWTRFAWVVDRFTPTGKDDIRVLRKPRAVIMLTSIRDAAKPLGDQHLVSLVQNYLDNTVTTLGQTAAL